MKSKPLPAPSWVWAILWVAFIFAALVAFGESFQGWSAPWKPAARFVFWLIAGMFSYYFISGFLSPILRSYMERGQTKPKHQSSR